MRKRLSATQNQIESERYIDKQSKTDDSSMLIEIIVRRELYALRFVEIHKFTLFVPQQPQPLSDHHLSVCVCVYWLKDDRAQNERLSNRLFVCLFHYKTDLILELFSWTITKRIYAYV